MDSIIEALQKQSSYTVTEIGDDGEREFTIDHYRALNSKHEMEKVVHEIATADIVTCAVGPNILKFVAEPVAKAIDARTLDYPIAVIACENAINATTTWRGFIESKLSEDSKSKLDKKARFANSAIDRIVPVQDADAGLNVKIEKFYEWCVEQTPFEKGGKKPDVKGIHYVDDLEPYIERKLFTVNTSHATAAYYGHQAKKQYIHEVLQDSKLHDIVRNTVKETAHLIVNKHGVSTKEQDEYVSPTPSSRTMSSVSVVPLSASFPARSASLALLLSWLSAATQSTLSSVPLSRHTGSRTSRVMRSQPNWLRFSRRTLLRTLSPRSMVLTSHTHSSRRSSPLSRGFRRAAEYLLESSRSAHTKIAGSIGFIG
jgi:hypothetical protein